VAGAEGGAHFVQVAYHPLIWVRETHEERLYLRKAELSNVIYKPALNPMYADVLDMSLEGIFR
jgi:hypothetical protein